MLNLSNESVAETVWHEKPRQSQQELLNPKGGHWLGRTLLVVGIVFLIILFLPWRQTIEGSGSLTALTPQDRPQTVQNAISGRIEHWAVREGQRVR